MESSADDTGVAIIDGARKKILSNVVMKQHAHHEEFQGIHPQVAIQWHQHNLPFALQRALAEAKMDVREVDGIAFTRGPGMGGCLSVSVNAGKALAAALNKPIVGVHHMQAHALTPELTNPDGFPGFPFLTLLISGGHTMIVLAYSNRKFKILATSADVAIGNAFDKVARMLHISPDAGKGYGAALEAFCRESASQRTTNTPLAESVKGEDKRREGGGRGAPFSPLVYSLPNLHQPEMFSFTGLTAAVQKVVEAQGARLDDSLRVAVAHAFQDAAFSQLESKLKSALRFCQANQIPIKSLVVSGGVASNLTLRERLRIFLDSFYGDETSLLFPPPELCTDNAAMIAWASVHRFLEGDYDDYGIQPLPKWSLEDLNRTQYEALCPANDPSALSIRKSSHRESDDQVPKGTKSSIARG
ncbi:peptidase M22, glycoprotease [Serendipita vermifera]|nr:peptidase M22, glycoprotease [Serendipita vermifera]